MPYCFAIVVHTLLLHVPDVLQILQTTILRYAGFVRFNSLFEFIILECAYRYRYLSLIISRGLLQQKDNSDIKSGIKYKFPFHLRLSRN